MMLAGLPVPAEAVEELAALVRVAGAVELADPPSCLVSVKASVQRGLPFTRNREHGATESFRGKVVGRSEASLHLPQEANVAPETLLHSRPVCSRFHSCSLRRLGRSALVGG